MKLIKQTERKQKWLQMFGVRN